MNITKKDIQLFNKTRLDDICFNDSYNLAKGYCSYSVFRALLHIKKIHYGMFSKGKKLTADILKQYPQDITII